MTTDQLLNARLARKRDNLRNRFAFNGSVLWTDTTGAAWLRDDWGHLLPVPNVVSN